MSVDRPRFEANYSTTVPSGEAIPAKAIGTVRANNEAQASAIVLRGKQLVQNWLKMRRMGIEPGAVRSDPSTTTVVQALWEGKGQSDAARK